MAKSKVIAISALEAVKKAMEKVKPELKRASEVLAPHEGKILKPLQYDRMRVNLEEGDLGGPEYSALSLYNPPHAKSGAVAAVSNKGALTRLINQYKDYGLNKVIHTPMLGSDIQHRGNPTNFYRFYNELIEKIKSGEVDQDKIKLINNKLNSIEHKKKPMFSENVDITSPDFLNQIKTFNQRSAFADVLNGDGIGGKKGQVIDVTTKLGETIEPYIADAPTGAFGHRLIELGTNTLYDPTLHGDYPYQVIGKDLGVKFRPIDKEDITDFVKKIMEDKSKARMPTDMDFRTGNVSQEITPEWLQYLKDKGNKDGGSIHADGSPRLANGASARKMVQYILKDQKFGVGGKALKKGLKLVEDVAEKVKLPPAENSARTQIVGTMPTYEKARDILAKEGIEGKDIIDFGSGKGLGSTMMKAHSFEPYPQGWYPTYTKSEDIPSDAYKGLLNLNVLNVLDPEMRAHTVKEIGRVMQPEGGTGLITTRGRDVMNTIGGRKGPEPMSVITSRDTYQKGFEPNELREYIKYILGGDFEYEPLNLGPAGVKIKKKAEGGVISDDAEEYGQQLKEQRKTLGSDILKSGRRGITEGIGNILQSAKETLSRAGTLGDIVEGYGKYGAPMEKARYEGITGTKIPQIKPVPYLRDQSITESPVGAKILPLTTGEQQFAGEIIGDPLSYSVSGAGRGLKKVGKFIGEGLAEAEATGRGPVGKVMQTIVPRMNIIKDQGGMLVGGEKALDDELLAMYKNEARYPHAHQYFVPEGDRDALKDPNAVALNNWVDTKVRKYLRNQAGTEADPILKTIESGVEHRFQPSMGDTKYYVRNKRFQVGKPEAGIAKTELGKEFEYKIDSMFDPKRSKDIKEILNSPMEFADPATAKRRKASLLRVEQDLPIENEADLDALSLINQIPDENVYTLSGTNITERLGLNHVSDVLYEDLMSGKLRPEQLNQMSIEKAIRRTAEYDAEKAKAMAKANASSVEGMPIPKAYDDGYKWVELKHDTDPKKTQAALKSEGEMMGHCVGGYCPEVESGEIKIYSLRGPDGKSHVTIEARPQFSMTLWRNANLDAINSNPKLKQYDFNMNSLDNDHKYGYRMTERDYVTEMTKEMKKLGINPVEPPSYMELHQVKGKQNKRPDEKYQSYISDFIRNNPTKHEIVDVFELDNTNLMGVQNVADSGLVPKDIHNHPEVEKAVKKRNAEYGIRPDDQFSIEMQEEHKYDLFKEVARDLARQNKNYLDKDEILNHIREKYLTPPKKAKGGSINLNQEYKLENMRRRYG